MSAAVEGRVALRATVLAVERGRRGRRRRTIVATSALGLVTLALLATSLMLGRAFVPLDDVVRVVLGQAVPGASFDVGMQRLPRALTGLAAGFAFGVAGSTFQTMFRNPLASPDFIGITAGSSAAAVFALLVLGLDGVGVTVAALVAGIATAALVTLLAGGGGAAGARFVLIGIGVGAALDAFVFWVLLRSDPFDVPAAMRWLTGSLSTPRWEEVRLVGLAVIVLLPLVLWLARSLRVLELGNETAVALGERVGIKRGALAIAAVALTACATATTGPIAFVAFLAGPIAGAIAGRGRLVAAGLVGASLVLAADLVGQLAFDTRFPVGVVTGIVGVPFLLFQLVRIQRKGSAS